MNNNTINGDVTMGGAEATLLAGRYRVVRQLGQGGMGSVWLAEDTQLDNREVAIKMLPSVLVSNKRAYQQLKAEALVSLKLTHPNIATVRAFEENNGNPFLVVDYIDGLTLDEYLGRKGKLTEEATASILLPVAEALDYAHEKGIVHRDVKPGNVVVTWDGVPYVLDFGIAREIQETMTRVTGKLSSGTLLYMSPEQLRGAAPKAAQDIYSFSVLAYECLTGHPPFSRGQIEYQILNEPPEPLPESIVMGRRVMRGLAKDPKDRPSSCRTIMKDWRAAFGMPQCEPGPSESPPSAPPPASRRVDPVPKQTDKTPLAAGDAETVRELPKRRYLAPVVFLALALLALLAVVVNHRAGSPSAPSNADAAEEVKPADLDSEYIDVGVLIGRVERLERSDGFGARIDQLQDAYRRAQKHFELSQWQEAKRLFAGVRRDAENVLSEDAARKKAKLPSLRLVAKVGGREVRGAKVIIGDRTYETPVDLGDVSAYGTQGPFTVSYTENYRLYEGRFQSIPVGWQGVKTLSFSLKEHEFPKAGARKVVSLPDGTSMAFRWCPAGEFVMGASGALGANACTTPHRVGLERGFWIGETEVTQVQWRRLMKTWVIDQAKKELESDVNFRYNVKTGEKRPHRGIWCVPKTSDPVSRIGDVMDEIPIYYVNWQEACEFCQRMTERLEANGVLPTGYECRLPTEAEWEYACRAGVGGSLLPNSKTPGEISPNNIPALEKIAWYAGTSAWNFTGRGWEMGNAVGRQHGGERAAPRKVGTTESNAWGIYDMLGNVAEWCADCWQISSSSTDVRPDLSPVVVSQSKTRVCRGGCWGDPGSFCTPWNRIAHHPLWRNNGIGFRVAIAPAYKDYPYDGDLVELAADTSDPNQDWVDEKKKTAGPERKSEELKPEAVPAKPTLLLSTTLNGVPVTAKVVDGLVESDAKTPTTVTLNNPIGTDWNYTIEYDAGPSIYRTEGSFRTRSGRHELTVRLEEGSRRPSSLNFCRHCRAALSEYVTIGTRCPSCHKNLYGD